MAPRHLLLLCTMTALALSGCAAEADPSADAGTGAAGGAAGGPSAATSEASLAAAPTPGAALDSLPFSKDGTTWTGGCVYTTAGGQCTPTPGDAWTVLESEGDFQRVAGRLTWEPKADYTLRLYLLTQAGGSWTWSRGDPAASSSTGALEFDWDVAGAGADEVMLTVNAYTGMGSLVVAAGASVPFDYHLEGVAESLAAS